MVSNKGCTFISLMNSVQNAPNLSYCSGIVLVPVVHTAHGVEANEVDGASFLDNRIQFVLDKVPTNRRVKADGQVLGHNPKPVTCGSSRIYVGEHSILNVVLAIFLCEVDAAKGAGCTQGGNTPHIISFTHTPTRIQYHPRFA